MVIELAVHHFLCSGSDRCGQLRRDAAKFLVYLCGGALDQCKRPDKTARESKIADGKIADGALCLRSPEGLVRYLHLTH